MPASSRLAGPRTRDTILARLNRPAGVAASVFLAAVVFVALRLVVAGTGDISHFVLATRVPFVNPATAPSGLSLIHGHPYDGEFYYRLALDPANLQKTAFGITLDVPFRLERIGYPFLAWLLAFGQAPLVPASLVLVNVLAMAAIGYLGAVVAVAAKRHALWGLLLPAYFGLWFSLARDLTEPVSAACLLAALLAYRRRRSVLAGGLFAYAALSRETALVAIAALALIRVLAIARRRARPGPADAAWAIPLVAFAAWQLTVWDTTREVPLSSNLHENAGSFLHPLAHAVTTNLSRLSLHHPDNDIWVVELAVLLVFTLGAGVLAPLDHRAGPRAPRVRALPRAGPVPVVVRLQRPQRPPGARGALPLRRPRAPRLASLPQALRARAPAPARARRRPPRRQPLTPSDRAPVAPDA